ncbi:unnamed protein product [Paramecium primaurelia]|uniref:Uncharacterized protein n=1 Tax=Paramecium primaurelia TaxID=5886 RepID=A0A8S1JQ47_PARPR|nr:unnamed protein product [Paramecium primaurelia]
MESFQNIIQSPDATYQLFIRKTQFKENNYKKVGFPIYGCKMNLQQSPRLNCQLKSQIGYDKNYKIRSNSVKHGQNNTYGQVQNKCQIYQQQINDVIQKRRDVNINSIEQQIYQGKLYKQYTQPEKRYSLVLPQLLFQKQKQKQKIVQNQAITEPSLIIDLQPWESHQNSITYF